MYNKCILTGHIGKNAEPTKKGNGCKFSLATSYHYKREGDTERTTVTQWHNCVLWGKASERLSKHLSKGTLVTVEGRYESTRYNDKDGNEKEFFSVNVQSITFLASPKQAEPKPAQKPIAKANPVEDMDLGDDLLF